MGQTIRFEIALFSLPNISQVALRKAPQNGAVGFKQEVNTSRNATFNWALISPNRSQVNKWVVLVKLLIGEIPERSLFRTAELRHVLAPYLLLTQSWFYARRMETHIWTFESGLSHNCHPFPTKI